MKTQFLYKNVIKGIGFFAFAFSLISCDFEFDLPESGSIEDLTPPSSVFTATQSDVTLTESEEFDTDTVNWRNVSFGNLSTSATSYEWDFGDGNTSTEFEPTNTYDTDTDATYTVTLTVEDALGQVSTSEQEVSLVVPDADAAITPEVIEGDFENGSSAYDEWRFADRTGYSSNPYNNTSNGSFFDYDGVDTGARTAGAKYDENNSAPGASQSSVRIGYQALTVTPERDYVIQFDYLLASGTADDGSEYLEVAILDGHYSTISDGVAASTLTVWTGYTPQGSSSTQSNWRVGQTVSFTSNASGLIAIRLRGNFSGSSSEGWFDNIKVYPAD